MEIKNETMLTCQEMVDVAMSRRKAKTIRWILYLTLSLLGFSYILVWWSGEEVDIPIWNGVLFVFFLLYLIFLPYRYKKLYKEWMGDSVHLSYVFRDGEVQCDMSSDVTKESSSTHPYESFTCGEFVKDHVLLYQTSNAMFPISLNGFASEADKKELIAHLKRHVKCCGRC